MPPRSGISTTTGNSSPAPGPTLKNLLKSSDILLKPPQPLSSNPIELSQRLKSCSKSLPKEWKKQIPEWSNEDELEHIGDNDLTNIDEDRKKRRRDELIFIIGKRCFILIKAIQSILEKEFWPKDLLNGDSNLEQKDCKLNLNSHQFSRRQRKNKKGRSNKKRRGSNTSTSIISPKSYKYPSNPHHYPPKCNHKHCPNKYCEHYISSSKSQNNNKPSYSSTTFIETQFPIPKLFKRQRRSSADLRNINLPNSVLLGTSDLRLIRLMLSHTTFSYLLPLASSYSKNLPNTNAENSESLSKTLESLLKLLKTSTPPLPSAGPSSATPIPPTTITQSLLSSHLIPIFLSTLIIAYTPSIPSETYSSLRSEFMKALMSLSPGHAISTLVNVLKLLVQGSKEGVKENGWVRVWPKYPKDIINGLLTAQVRRPGGVRGLMENVLGETAKTDDVTSIEGQRLDHIFNVLIRIPRHVTPEIYYPWLLSELFAMIPLKSHSHLPVAYVNTACYCIQRLWASNRPLIGDWLKNKLHSPWYPKLPITPVSNDKIIITTWEAIHRSIQNMRLLLIHNPTSPEFSNFLVGSILAPLFSLYTFLNQDQILNSNQFIKERKTTKEKERDEEISLAEGVHSLLLTWGKSVNEDAGVTGLWEIVEGGTGWGKDNEDYEFSKLYWEKEGEGVKLMVTSSTENLNPEITLPSLTSNSSSEEEHLANLLLSRQTSSPDPQLLCQLIESLDRPNIASEVILKSLDSWRIKISTEMEPSIESLNNLQLTIQMMEKLGSQLFTRPSQVLGFVERVLSDQIQSLDTHSTNSMDEKKPVIVDISGIDDESNTLDDDVAPDGKRGLIEVACQLLASLESEGQLKNRSPILQPIISHLDILSRRSPSVSIRNAAREAQLLLSHDDVIDRPTQTDTKEASYEIYKQAIDLIHDSTLPVKVHGMNILKDLVTSSFYDKSLTTDILDIYMEQLDNQDSFVYLSAIKGLSGMVDTLGKDVFQALIGRYIQDLESLKVVKEEKIASEIVERVLRLAESIDQVIEKTAEALGLYADEIVPPFQSVFPNSSLPTVVRSSALSILATCARVSPFAILPWATELAESTLDLVQIESVPSSPFRPENNEVTPPEEIQPKWGKSKFVQLVEDDPIPEEPSSPSNEPSKPRIIDDEPTKSSDNKHPTLRRSALTLLDWSIRVLLFIKFVSFSESEEDTNSLENPQIKIPSNTLIEIKTKKPENEINEIIEENSFSPRFMDKAITVLNYIIKTDTDEIVRQHAQSALKDLLCLKNDGLDFLQGDQGEKVLESLKSLRI